MNAQMQFFRVIDDLENQLLTCLCDMLIEEGRPVCACHHYASDQAMVADRCNTEGVANGQAWVRRGSSSLIVPEDDTFGGGACGSGAWSTQIQMGIYRCINAIPDEDGNAPDVADYAADRELLMADRQTLANVLCCDGLNNNDDELPQFDFPLSVESASVETIGPQGACAGSMLTLSIVSMLLQEDPPEEAGPIFISRPAGGG